MIAGCCREFLFLILSQIKIIINTEMAAVVMNRITKIDEAEVAAKMIVLSCNVALMLLEVVGRVVVTIEVNDKYEVVSELLVGFTVIVKSELLVLGFVEFDMDPELLV